MMSKKIACFPILFLLFQICVDSAGIHADQPALPEPFVKTSDNGRFYFKMLPGDWNWNRNYEDVENHPFGISYELMRDGKSRELWRVDGWYAFSVFLSNDGMNLVRVGVIQNETLPSEEDLAVAFYVNGDLVKEYSTGELITEPDKLLQSVSFYYWIDFDSAPELTHEKMFSLKTADGWSYVFSAMTGEIVSKKRS